jgi:mercuric ion transport protein
MIEKLLAAGGAVSALVASTCCIVPLALVSVGISGAWIGSLTALAAYQPLFLAIAVASLGAGFWFVYRPASAVCATGNGSTRTGRRFLTSVLWVKGILWLGATLVALAIGVEVGGCALS